MILHDAVEVIRKDIPDYLTTDNYSVLEFYNNYKRFGFAYAGGWAQQPARHIDIIQALDIEGDKLESWRKNVLRSRSSRK